MPRPAGRRVASTGAGGRGAREGGQTSECADCGLGKSQGALSLGLDHVVNGNPRAGRGEGAGAQAALLRRLLLTQGKVLGAREGSVCAA